MFARALTVAAGVACFGLLAAPAHAVTAGPSCGRQVAKGDGAVEIRILFAKNGAVQRYEVVSSEANTESVNNLRLALEREYGPAGVNAPPLQIVSLKKAKAGDMMLPDKAVDSCGRTSSYL